jgi:hypothetical protein
MSMKRVWFPPETKPVNPGVYLVEKNVCGTLAKYWRFFDGVNWRNGVPDSRPSPDSLEMWCNRCAAEQDVYWCGLVKEIPIPVIVADLPFASVRGVFA